MRRESINEGAPSDRLDGELDLRGVGRAIARRKLWVIGATLGCLACAAAYVSVVKPRYTADAKVLVENQENYFTRPSTANAPSAETQAAAIDAEAVASQVQLVTSRDLARDVIKALDLRGNAEFDPSAGGGFLSSLLGGHRASSDSEKVVEAYFEHLNVFSVVKSRVIEIEFSSQDPDLAARAANKIADLYIGLQADAKRAAARAAAESLASLIADLRTKVSQAESKAEEFRANAGLTIGANNVTTTGQQLTDLSSQLTLAKSAQAEAQAKARFLRDIVKQGRLGDISDINNNDLIRRLSEQRATLRAQIASESRTLLPGHPRIQELSAQLKELDGQVRVAVDRAATALENDARVAGGRVDNLQAIIGQQKKTIGGSSVDEAQARELDRDARLLKDQLETSVSKYQEAVARENSESTPGDARIISRAVAPQLPSFPKKLPIVAFAALAGLLLSLGFLTTAELMSGRAYAEGPIHAPVSDETPVGAPPLHARGERATLDEAIGGIERKEPRVFVEAAPSSTALSGLAARLAAGPAGDFAQRVLVTSEAENVSARDVALALGRALARDHRVVLIDFDQATAAEDEPGFGELLAGHATFEDTIHRDRASRLHIVSAGVEPIEYGENADLILDALSRTYDFVIVVAPPISSDALAFGLAPDADCAVLACAEEPSQATLDDLRRAGAGEAIAIAATAHVAGSGSVNADATADAQTARPRRFV